MNVKKRHGPFSLLELKKLVSIQQDAFSFQPFAHIRSERKWYNLFPYNKCQYLALDLELMKNS
jgi:hypothetical protein